MGILRLSSYSKCFLFKIHVKCGEVLHIFKHTWSKVIGCLKIRTITSKHLVKMTAYRYSMTNGLCGKHTPGKFLPVRFIPPYQKRTRLHFYSNTVILNTSEIIWIIHEWFSDELCLLPDTHAYMYVYESVCTYKYMYL